MRSVEGTLNGVAVNCFSSEKNGVMLEGVSPHTAQDKLRSFFLSKQHSVSSIYDEIASQKDADTKCDCCVIKNDVVLS